MYTRRRFLKGSLAGCSLVSLSASVPQVLLASSLKASVHSDERILVVLQLSGGNDGLNTIIPFGSDEYYRNRFTLAIPRDQVRKIDGEVGFHPALVGMSQLLDKGQVSVIQGVGYPNPNRSHFESMDLWHTAHRQESGRQLGWIGRSADQNAAQWSNQGTVAAIHLGDEPQPLALAAESTPLLSIRDLASFRLDAGDDAAVKQAIESAVANQDALRRGVSPATGTDKLPAARASDRPASQDLLRYVEDSTRVALTTSDQLQTILKQSKSSSSYPASMLGQKMKAIASLIQSGLGTRIYYLTQDGFDTHANQGQAHANLLGEMGDALAAFMKEMMSMAIHDRVVVMVFSEFGRRVRENASAGTDHGSAAPMMLVGGKVRPGAINAHPSLVDLDDGDLKFAVDYRSVYSAVLEKWLGVSAESIVGRGFDAIDCFA